MPIDFLLDDWLAEARIRGHVQPAADKRNAEYRAKRRRKNTQARHARRRSRSRGR